LKQESFVSIVVLGDMKTVDELTKLRKIHQELDDKYIDFEILIITSESDYSSEYVNGLESIVNTLSCIRHIHLSSGVKRDVMYAAGAECAAGDFVVLMNVNSDPASIISTVVDECKSGFDVVIGKVDKTRTLVYTTLRRVFSGLIKAVGYDLPKNSTELRCLSRRAVNSITRSGRYHHKFYMRIQKTGFNIRVFNYEFNNDFIEKANIIDMSRYFLSLLIFNSTKPLRFASILGGTGSLFAFCFALFSIVSHAVKGNVADGWTTIVLFMSLLFSILFFILTIFGEYLARLLDDRSEQSDYSIIDENTSVVMVNEDRVNVLSSATSVSENKVQKGRR